MEKLTELESGLQSSGEQERIEALQGLAAGSNSGEIGLPGMTRALNMHCHSFYSYNPDFDSPSTLAWRARKHGLWAAGIVDFDVLDGIDEFLQAGEMLGLAVVGGIETRVFLKEFAEFEINSPGEPGIAYHMGAGMPGSMVPPEQSEFLLKLKYLAQQRNRRMIAKLNSFTAPLELDCEKDILPLTPNGNPTERHIAQAYMERASAAFENDDKLKMFWEEKLGELPLKIDCRNGFDLQLLIRKKLMKRGGVGYTKPDLGSFPAMHDFNAFVLACGGIPTSAWLDGTTPGEQRLDELLDLEMRTGLAAVNLIPDRNYSKGNPDRKLDNMNEFVRTADERGLPVLAGTELNAPGLKFVDDFDCDELAPIMPLFIKGARIVYAHSVLQRSSGMGFCSPWANIHFPDLVDRNKYYNELGLYISPSHARYYELDAGMGPEQALAHIQGKKQ